MSGYRYAAQERNRITGNARDETSSRIDVVAWEVEAPYSALGGATADRTVTENLHEPVRHATTAKDHSPDSFSLSEDQSERVTDSCIEVPS